MELSDIVIEPRFCETDALRHISNTVLPIWFESARGPLFRAILTSPKIEDWSIIVARISVDFLAQIYFGFPVTISTAIKKVGSKSFTIQQRAYQKGKAVAEAETVLVYFDFKEQSTKEIPDVMRQKIEQLPFALPTHN